MESKARIPQPQPHDDLPSYAELITFWKTHVDTVNEKEASPGTSPSASSIISARGHASRRGSSAAVPPSARHSSSSPFSPRAVPIHICEPAFFSPPKGESSFSSTLASTTTTTQPSSESSHSPYESSITGEPEVKEPPTSSALPNSTLIPPPASALVKQRKLSLDEGRNRAEKPLFVRAGSEDLRRESSADCTPFSKELNVPSPTPKIEREDSLESELKQLMEDNQTGNSGTSTTEALEAGKKAKKRKGRKKSKDDEGEIFDMGNNTDFTREHETSSSPRSKKLNKKKEKEREKERRTLAMSEAKKEKKKRGKHGSKQEAGSERDDEKSHSLDGDGRKSPNRRPSVRKLKLFGLRNSIRDRGKSIHAGSQDVLLSKKNKKSDLLSSVSEANPGDSLWTSSPGSAQLEKSNQGDEGHDYDDGELVLRPISARIPPTTTLLSPTSPGHSASSPRKLSPRSKKKSSLHSIASLLNSLPTRSAPPSPSSSKGSRIGSLRISYKRGKERDGDGKDGSVELSFPGEPLGSLQRTTSARNIEASTATELPEDAGSKRLKHYARWSSINFGTHGSPQAKIGSMGRRAREMMAYALGMSSTETHAIDSSNEGENQGKNMTPPRPRSGAGAPTGQEKVDATSTEVSSDKPKAGSVIDHSPSVRWLQESGQSLTTPKESPRTKLIMKPKINGNAGLLLPEHVVDRQYPKPPLYSSRLSLEAIPCGRRKSLPPIRTPRSESEQLDEPVPDALIDSSPGPSPRLVTPSNSPLHSSSGRWFMRRNTDPSPPMPHLRFSNQYLDISRASIGLSSSNTVMEGYLLKRNNRGRWKRRWMVLNNTHFYGFRSPQDPFCSLAIDLMFSSVKPLNMASRHGFELITMDKNYAFDVFTREALEAWTTAIQRVCAGLLKKNISRTIATDTSESDGSLSDSKSARLALLRLQKEECNMLCADCNARDPDWVLSDLGAFICIECAAVHRRLGLTISQVRSIKLDAWDARHVEFMRQHGNQKMNQWWEYRKVEGIRKPAPPIITESEREKYIRLKYEKKLFTKDCPISTVEEALARETKNESMERMKELKAIILTLVREDAEFCIELRNLLLASASQSKTENATPQGVMSADGTNRATSDGKDVRQAQEEQTAERQVSGQGHARNQETKDKHTEKADVSHPVVSLAQGDGVDSEGTPTSDVQPPASSSGPGNRNELTCGVSPPTHDTSEPIQRAKTDHEEILAAVEEQTGSELERAIKSAGETPQPSTDKALHTGSKNARKHGARERNTPSSDKYKRKSKKEKKDDSDKESNSSSKKSSERSKEKSERRKKTKDKESDNDKKHEERRSKTRSKHRRSSGKDTTASSITPVVAAVVPVASSPKQFPRLVIERTPDALRHAEPPSGSQSARGARDPEPRRRQSPRASGDAPLQPSLQASPPTISARLAPSWPQPLSKIEAKAERQVLIGKRKAAVADNLDRGQPGSGTQTLLRRYAHAYAMPPAADAATSAAGASATNAKESPMNERRGKADDGSAEASASEPSALGLSSGVSRRSQHSDSSSISSSSSALSSSTPSSTKHRSKRSRGSGGSSSKPSSRERDGAASPATSSSTPSSEARIVQKMKKMGGILPAPHLRRGRSSSLSSKEGSPPPSGASRPASSQTTEPSPSGGSGIGDGALKRSHATNK